VKWAEGGELMILDFGFLNGGDDPAGIIRGFQFGRMRICSGSTVTMAPAVNSTA
jgi:hypothetical protein